MFRRILFFIAASAAAFAQDVRWSGPISVLSGQTYDVAADPNNVAATRVTIYRNGLYFTDGMPYYTHHAATDYGQQVVPYTATVDNTTVTPTVSYYGSRSVTVGNTPPPTVEDLNVPQRVLAGQKFTVTFQVKDANSDLLSVGLRWQGVGLVVGEGNTGDHFDIAGGDMTKGPLTFTAPSTAGTIRMRVEVWDHDNNGVTGDWVDIPVTVDPAPGKGLTAEYFANENLTGGASLIRTDANVNFNWGEGSPGPNLPADNFSVRWTGLIIPRYTGTYKFTTTSDDGARLWVNGVQLINHWAPPHAPAEGYGQIDLVKGNIYTIKMESYDLTWGAVAQLQWETLPSGGIVLQPKEYVPNSALSVSGIPAPTALAPNGLTDTAFTANWTGFSAANGYLIDVATAPDFSGTLVRNGVDVGKVTSYAVTGLNTANKYYYRIRAYNPSGTSTSSNVIEVDLNATGLKGEYFSNKTLTGPVTYFRTDPTIGFDWDQASPAPGIPTDNFSVRWTGKIQPRYTGSYTFTTTSDDGIKLWINGAEVINDWGDHGANDKPGTIALTAGTKYDIKVEFYDSLYSAVAKLQWQSDLQEKEIVPQSRLYQPVEVAPTITVDPAPVTVGTGATAVFSVTASGSPAPTFQWRKDGAAIGGQTGATLTLTNVQAANAGNYSVVVTNSVGTKTSANALLTVIARAVSMSPAADRTILAGQSATYTSTANSPNASLTIHQFCWQDPAGHWNWESGGANGLTLDSPSAQYMGATSSNTRAVVVTPTQPGIYHVYFGGYDSAGWFDGAHYALTVLPDADRDGIADSWEGANGLSSANASDALLDNDGDGLSNVAEYNLGTNPNGYDAGKSAIGNTIPSGWPSTGNPSNPLAIGSTRGELAVDKNGAATYSIPLWVSPGTAGMEPKLSLNYSSQSGPGVAGYGWSLTGISRITRGPQTMAVDNAVHGVDFTDKDQFYLDGRRLILVSGTHGTDGAEYRTEVDSFTKVVLKNSINSSSAWFQAWTKAGLILELGNSAASAFNPGRPEILSWSVNKISDTKGNSIRFEYSEESENSVIIEQLLRGIYYTERTGNDYYAAVKFDYEIRPDFSRGYTAGVRVSSNNRLTFVRSLYSGVAGTLGNIVRTYQLNYEPSTARPNTPRSLLKGIEEIAYEGSPQEARYPALAFSYEPPTEGWQTASGFAPPALLAQDGTRPRGTGFIDLNGDGRPDFVQYHRWNADGGLAQRGAWLNTPTGWVAASGWLLPDASDVNVPAGGNRNNFQCVLAWDEFGDFGTRFVDLNGDGLVDVIHSLKRTQNGSAVYYSAAYLNTGSGWSRAPQWDLPAPAYLASEGDLKGSSRLIDINGDGRVDVIWNYDAANKGAMLNTGNGWQTASAQFTPPIKIDGSVIFIDVNGDGLPDELQYWSGSGGTVRGAALNTGSYGWTQLAAGSADFNRFAPPLPLTVQSPNGGIYSPVGAEAVDLNGDGLIDLAWNNPALGWTSAYFNTGAGWMAAPAEYTPKFKLMDNNTAVGSALIDVNGDGFVDQVVYKESVPADIGVYLGTGHGWTDRLTSQSFNVPWMISRFDTTRESGGDFVDLDGDGLGDQVWNLSGNSSDARRNGASAADRLHSVTNGFGVAATFAYGPLTDSTIYTKMADTQDLPLQEQGDVANLIGPTYVVKTVIHDDGIGGQYPVNYRYGGLRSHRLRGSLGFEWMSVTDGRTNIVSTSTFSQSFPTIGMPVSNTTKSGTTFLSESIVSYADHVTFSAKVHFPFANNTVVTTRDLRQSNSTFSTQISTYIPDPESDVDDNGNIKALVVDSGDGFSKTTVNVYADDNSKWLLGRLVKSTVTSKAPGKADISRTSGFLYDSTTGLLTDEAVEPSLVNNQLAASYTDLAGYNTNSLRTHYDYDDFGNKTTVRVSGLKVQVAANGTVTSASQLETRSSSTTYDNLGRLQTSTTNAAGHTESYLDYDQALAALRQLKGPNGLVTSWSYDSFGQKTHESRADGTVTDIRIKWAAAPDGATPAKAKYQIEQESTGSAPAIAFYDAFGRTIRSLSINGNGAIVYRDTSFDSMGRAYSATTPYLNDGSTVYATQTTSYDLLNRPLIVRTPDDGIQAGYVETSYAYDGLVASVTDAKGRITESTRNSQGWVVSTIRNKSAAPGAADYALVSFTHDALGNVTDTVASGVATHIDYDIRGRKTQMIDGDMGTWLYRHNTFGDLIWQKDANNQIVTLGYDLLGRLVSRSEAEGTTTWSFDTAAHASPPAGAPATWVGMLGSVSAPGPYTETHSYDGFGRLLTTARTIDGATYNASQTYDGFGRPEKTIYPTSFQTINVYNAFGFLKEIRRYVNGPKDLYWQADHYAADGRIDGEVYGNGFINDRVYSVATGRLVSANIDAGTVSAAPYRVQQLSYSYDAMGNVTRRLDTATGRDERFSFSTGADGYDGLDRLRVHRIIGGATVTVDYDQQGNITNKSDVGSFAYNYTPIGHSTASPHAVSSAGANTYTYDSNGNMKSGAGRTLAWTSYNQLRRADMTGGKFSEFAFGAAHERIKQTSHLGTTIYIGALYEKVTSGSLIENKHYIISPNGRVAIRTERNDATVETRYFHSDGLGSITCVSDELGRVTKRFAFDAWGKRVDPQTNAAITSSTSGTFTRGFTDHEQLDDLGLVHMNGRIYEPTLGRFLSADPYFGDVQDSQDYNRYAYVGNNPLGSIDASGYFSLKDGIKIAAVVAIAWAGGYFAIQAWGVESGVAFAGGLHAAGLSSTVVNGIIGGGVGGFTSGFSGSLLNGGGVGDAFKAGVIGGFTGAITGGIAAKIGDVFEGYEPGILREAGRATAHGVSNGLVEEAQGGQFRHGFYSGFAGSLGGSITANLGGDGPESVAARTTVSAVVGGTASVLGGGKFANGAVSAMFQHLFNAESHQLITALDRGNDADQTFGVYVVKLNPIDNFAQRWYADDGRPGEGRGTFFGGRVDAGNRRLREILEVKPDTPDEISAGRLQLGYYRLCSGLQGHLYNAGGMRIGDWAFKGQSSITLQGKYGTYTYTNVGNGLVTYTHVLKRGYKELSFQKIGALNAGRSRGSIPTLEPIRIPIIP